MNDTSFSSRFGYKPQSVAITVREDAPQGLREAIVMLAYNLGLKPHDLRSEICGILLKRPDPDNWSAYPNVSNEVDELMSDAPWHRVYDIAEGFFKLLFQENPNNGLVFENRLNDFFLESGIGWCMEGGRIVTRGSLAFTEALHGAVDIMKEAGKSTASKEMQEAISDLSRRPNADITGAIQHAMAALECVAREVTGMPSKTLGQLIDELRVPKPLDIALDKLWGFTSEQGRHVREGRLPHFKDAELIVTISSALCSYLLKPRE